MQADPLPGTQANPLPCAKDACRDSGLRDGLRGEGDGVHGLCGDVEEVELAYRFYKAGWESWYLPQWKIVHYGQMTNGSEKATIFEMQNLKLFYKKHYPKWQLVALTITLKFGAFLRILFYSLLDPKVAKIYAKAFASI